MTTSKFIGTRKPTADEKKKGAEIVFIRETPQAATIEIYACKVYESWEQWNAPEDILRDNVNQVEKWRKSKK